MVVQVQVQVPLRAVAFVAFVVFVVFVAFVVLVLVPLHEVACRTQSPLQHPHKQRAIAALGFGVLQVALVQIPLLHLRTLTVPLEIAALPPVHTQHSWVMTDAGPFQGRPDLLAN